MERMVKNDKVSKDDPYSARLNDAYKSLKLYIREKKKTPEIQSGELNGIYGLLGMTPSSVSHASPRKSKGLGSVMSSADLVRMDFDTIGLEGKFLSSWGSIGRIYGQRVWAAKSGKSTLMLEFAHHQESTTVTYCTWPRRRLWIHLEENRPHWCGSRSSEFLGSTAQRCLHLPTYS